MVKRIIKEYELFDGGASSMELYRHIGRDTPAEQFQGELNVIDELAETLKKNGVSHFRLSFPEGDLEKDVAEGSG